MTCPIATSILALYAQDPKAVCLIRLAWVELWAGDAGRANETARAALELAVDLNHLMTLWYVITYTAIIAAESEDLARLAELLGTAERLSKRLAMPYLMIVGEALGVGILVPEAPELGDLEAGPGKRGRRGRSPDRRDG